MYKATVTARIESAWGAEIKSVIGMQGMEYLHSKNIVHFDLKSANLLLGWRDRRAICKVADFGLSKQKRETFVSNVSSQRGTLPWIAPEIIKNPNTVNEKVCPSEFEPELDYPKRDVPCNQSVLHVRPCAHKYSSSDFWWLLHYRLSGIIFRV